MTTVNAIAAVPIFNFGSPFESLPLRNYTAPNPIKVTNLVSINSITLIPPLTFSATSDNVAVATAAISGKNVLVNGLQPGTAHITDTGRAPGASQESAILTTLAPGRYTAIVRGVGGTSGVALVEVYDQDSGRGSLLANLSTRSGVGTGNNVMIGGIILTGQKTIIVRALGPTLTQFGVANALNDPTLELRNAQGTLVDSNDNWQSSPKSAQIQASGLAPPDSAEPAVLATLPMGNYTAIVRGVRAVPTGLALLEIYPQ